jgi:DNA-binding FadR family transcriptional regulator
VTTTNTLPPSSSRNLVQDAAEALRRYVLEGHLGPGDELPSQGELCAELGVSRSVIREAMQVLQSQGLIEISQGRRPRVLPAGPAAVVDTLSMLVARSEIALAKLLEVRRPLEIEIAGLAAERATAQQRQQLREAVDALRAAPNIEAQIAADVRFHKVLAEASGNPLFGIVLDVLAELLYQSRRHTLQQSGVAMALSHHRKILAAVEAANPVKARTFMIQHMEQTRADLAQHTGG